MKKKQPTALEIANDIINNTQKYELVYSQANTSKKILRSKLVDMYDDCQIMLKDINTEFEPDMKSMIDKHLVALKKLSEDKAINETRVRFWINIMSPIMKNIGQALKDQVSSKE